MFCGLPARSRQLVGDGAVADRERARVEVVARGHVVVEEDVAVLAHAHVEAGLGGVEAGDAAAEGAAQLLSERTATASVTASDISSAERTRTPISAMPRWFKACPLIICHSHLPRHAGVHALYQSAAPCTDEDMAFAGRIAALRGRREFDGRRRSERELLGG